MNLPLTLKNFKLQMESKIEKNQKNTIGKNFIKSIVFYLRVILVAFLTVGWISILIVELSTASNNTSFIDCTLYFDIIKYNKPIYFSVTFIGWLTSIIYISLNLCMIQESKIGIPLKLIVNLFFHFIIFRIKTFFRFLKMKLSFEYLFTNKYFWYSLLINF
jgi:hypothetical protein